MPDKRKLIYFANMSLDGFIDAADENLEWIRMDEELHRFINQRESQSGAYVYGRRMYELMAAYWPTADTQSTDEAEIEYAKIWKRMPIYVFSSTLERVEGNAILVREDAVETVARLKEQPGGHLGVGGAKLASALMQAGLIDEYQIYLHPAILGEGVRMFPVLSEVVKLQLVETHRFNSGVAYLHYQR